MHTENLMIKPPRLIALFWIFLKAGTVSFGGGIIAYLREYIVSQQQWLTDQEFFKALEISQTLPGITPINLSVIVGDLKKGAWGSVVAVVGLLLPGAIIILFLGLSYLQNINNPQLTAFLMGIAAGATGFIFKMASEIGLVQLKNIFDYLLMSLTFLSIGVLHIPLIIVLLMLAPLGIYFYRPRIDKAIVEQEDLHG
jgi:chromate transporter